MTVRLVVNGAPYEASDGDTVADLARAVGLRPDVPAAVEVNGAVLPRGEWPRRTLAAGDRVEIVILVGGG